MLADAEGEAEAWVGAERDAEGEADSDAEGDAEAGADPDAEGDRDAEGDVEGEAADGVGHGPRMVRAARAETSPTWSLTWREVENTFQTS